MEEMRKRVDPDLDQCPQQVDEALAGRAAEVASY